MYKFTATLLAATLALGVGLSWAEDPQDARRIRSIQLGLDNADQIQDLRVKSGATVGGNVTIGGTVTLTGGFTTTGPLSGTSLSVSGASTSATAVVTGAASAGNLTVSGASTSATLKVTGASTLAAVSATHVTASGAITGATAVISGAASAGNLTVSGASTSSTLVVTSTNGAVVDGQQVIVGNAVTADSTYRRMAFSFGPATNDTVYVFPRAFSSVPAVSLSYGATGASLASAITNAPYFVDGATTGFKVQCDNDKMVYGIVMGWVQ